MKTIRAWILAVISIAFVATALIAGPAAQASADSTRNGACDQGEFCYYYNSGGNGSVSDFGGSLGNYGSTQPDCYEFKGTGNGYHECIKNDAAAVWNRTNRTVRVYLHSNYEGTHQDFGPGAKVNLSPELKNNNASHQFLPNAPTQSGPPPCDETRFQDAVRYISGEMLSNEISKTFLTIKTFNYPTRIQPDRYQTPAVAAAALFYEKVKPHGDWDQKDALQALLPVNPNSDEDKMLQICGGVHIRINYDYFSNMHYGYIGMKAYFTDRVLLKAESLRGIKDPADKIAIQAGIDMSRQPDSPTVDTVRRFIIDSIPRAIELGYTGLVRQ